VDTRTAWNPTTLAKPAFAMSLPFSHSTTVANNAWMADQSEDERAVDRRRGLVQFLDLYHYISSEAVVCLVPSVARSNLQDLVFTANLGIVLDHLPDRNTALVSNFTSEPRRGETPIGVTFFEMMDYTTTVVPFRFEGEAELKHLHDNVYIGGYGVRSERKAYEWMEDRFDIKILPVREADPYLYHLDCTVFPVTRDCTLICTELLQHAELAAIEAHTNVIDVSRDECYAGICNSVRLNNTILNASHIHDLSARCADYASERAKNRRLEDIGAALGLEPCFFNLSEYLKSGALLSCLILHLNRRSYAFTLV
jgi:N-dimethylarginine dimethylaminohydrolase